MNTINILFFVLLITAISYSQIIYEEAPEKWTMPVKIIRGAYPSISWDGNKLFFRGIDISYIEKTEDGWSDTIRLGPQVNHYMFYRKPVLSPSGKELYFTATEDIRIYRSRWNVTINDWDTARIFEDNGISHGIGAWYVSSFLNDTAMILNYWGDGKISYYDSISGLWSAPVYYPHPALYIHSDWGSWVSPDRKKHYYAEHWNDNGDLHVTYLNDTTGTYVRHYKLNISFITDSLYSIGQNRENDERYTFLTPDGRTMYFMANYDTTGGNWSIYESKMFIDENGDTVLTDIKEQPEDIKPSGYELFQNYPNPFNPRTKISWQSPVSSWQTLKVYDVLGNEVATLVNESKPAGSYEAEWNASSLPSGVYIYQLVAGTNIQMKKMLLLK